MIRVIYRWTIDAGSREPFIEEWERLTRWIRTEFDGSYGSTLLESDEDSVLIGIARWASRSHLLAFRDQAGALHLPGADLESMELLAEIAHLTAEE
ncbi:MAG: antibiotic biosynthesis monooxygenase [Acidimicrobiales bacterium]